MSIYSKFNDSVMLNLIALTKPRVNLLIIFTAIVGMLLAQDFNLNYSLMMYASIGIYLAASAAAVINHIVDQKIDAIMDRTKGRPLIKGNVTSNHAIYFSVFISSMLITNFSWTCLFSFKSSLFFTTHFTGSLWCFTTNSF